MRTSLAMVLPALGVIVAVTGLTIAWWWAHPPDPVGTLRSHWAPLEEVERMPRPDLGARVERWIVRDVRGRKLQGLWRAAPPSQDGGPVWTGVLLGGLETGDRAALLIPDDLPVHVLAMDWPWEGPRSMGTAEFLRRLPAIRTAVLSSPGVLALGADAAATQPEVDPGRIALIGVSLGVPAAMGALRMTDAPGAIVLADGAARLDRLIERDLKASDRHGWAAGPLASLAMRLIDAMEPLHHADAVQRLPTLLVSAKDDDRFPPEAIQALHDALPGADRVWRPGAHVHPDASDVVAALVSDIHGWLEARPGPR